MLYSTLVGVVVVQSLKLSPTLCQPMDCSNPDFSVLHYLPEFAQTHVLWVDDAIQPSLLSTVTGITVASSAELY